MTRLDGTSIVDEPNDFIDERRRDYFHAGEIQRDLSAFFDRGGNTIAENTSGLASHERASLEEAIN